MPGQQRPDVPVEIQPEHPTHRHKLVPAVPICPGEEVDETHQRVDVHAPRRVHQQVAVHRAQQRSRPVAGYQQRMREVVLPHQRVGLGLDRLLLHVGAQRDRGEAARQRGEELDLRLHPLGEVRVFPAAPSARCCPAGPRQMRPRSPGSSRAPPNRCPTDPPPSPRSDTSRRSVAILRCAQSGASSSSTCTRNTNRSRKMNEVSSSIRRISAVPNDTGCSFSPARVAASTMNCRILGTSVAVTQKQNASSSMSSSAKPAGPSRSPPIDSPARRVHQIHAELGDDLPRHLVVLVGKRVLERVALQHLEDPPPRLRLKREERLRGEHVRRAFHLLQRAPAPWAPPPPVERVVGAGCSVGTGSGVGVRQASRARADRRSGQDIRSIMSEGGASGVRRSFGERRRTRASLSTSSHAGAGTSPVSTALPSSSHRSDPRASRPCGKYTSTR